MLATDGRIEGTRSLASLGVVACSLAVFLSVSATMTRAGFSSTTANPSNVFTASSCFQPAAVSISSFAFTPGTITIDAGCSVKWTNTATIKHTTTSNTGIWDSGSLNQNDTFTLAFNSVGSFPYKCKIHSSMQGTVNVN